MNDLDLLLRVLQISVERNGKDKVLTLDHFRNLVGVAIKMKSYKNSRDEYFLEKLGAEMSDQNQ